MPAKKKPVKKEEEAESSSSDSSSSSGEEAPAPKKKVAAKKKPKEEEEKVEAKAKPKAKPKEESSSSDEAPAPKKKVAAKRKPKEEKAAKEETSSSDEAPAPKKKVAAKRKPKEEASTSSSSGSDSEGDGGDKKEDKPAEEKKVFVPPPRPVFTPHTAMADITGPQEVEYCPVDGLPADFCIHGPSWDKSKPWCLENYPQYYPELCDASLEEAQKAADKATAKSKAKQLPGGKKVAEASPAVTIKKMSRGGRKCVTSVAGLDSFGVSMEACAKIFKKKFACGSSVVKGDHGLADTVDIQGDFEEEVIDILLAEYKIPRSKVELVDGGTKKKGKPQGAGPR